MKSPFHHLKHPEGLFDHFHDKIHHAFAIFALAIIGMLRGASHILVPTSASRQRGGFLTSDFREQNPSNENIMYALFGDGISGATAYTRLRNTSCVPSSVVTLSAGFSGITGAANTIYILNAGTYTLTSPIVMNSCSALLGKGEVYIRPSNSSFYPLSTTSSNEHIIIDNIKINGSALSTRGISFMRTANSTLNNIDSYQNAGYGIYFGNLSANISVSNSRIYDNVTGAYVSNDKTINNSQFYNNTVGIQLDLFKNVAINNSQMYNNIIGIKMGYTNPACITGSIFGSAANTNNSINNSLMYDNTYGIFAEDCFDDNNGSTANTAYTYMLNNVRFYNNTYGMLSYSNTPDILYYGTLKFFANANDMSGTTNVLAPGSGSSIPSWADGQLDTASTAMDYDRVTNPQNGSGQRLLNGTNRGSLRGPLAFTVTKRPLRYIFGGNISKQIIPVRYNASTLQEFGANGSDYTTTQYITESDSSLPLDQQLIVNQYFGSNSLFTQNRQTNGCSLSAFQVKTLTPGTYTTANNTFEDHTIYILTGGEYISSIGGASNGFVFNGNCIALIGTNTTRFTKTGLGSMNSMFYANNKRNIIIDNIKVDGLYSSDLPFSPAARIGIDFDGASNNNTFNNIQIYNHSLYGIYLGLNSHHNTIMNGQLFNNAAAGMHLYYSSNYNVINNTQIYNNGSYGIRFANGSKRNTINNFQVYNNDIGIFGDLTTQDNVINRAVIYNNSTAGIYLKNSSGNMLNDVRVFNNGVGIRTLYGSLGNKYYGELYLFDNIGGNFDGTNGNDSYLSAGGAGLFPYGGTLSVGSNLASCFYATNPMLSGTAITLLSGDCIDKGYIPAFQSIYNTYVNYTFGLNMYKQKVPVRYNSGNSLVQMTSQYDANKYIAEMFPLRDITPEGVNFVGSGAAELNSRYITNTYTVGTINTPVPVVLNLDPGTTTGYFTITTARKNPLFSGNYTGLTGIINNGDMLQIRLFTQPGHNQTTTGTITIGTVTTTFTVTTRGLSQTPSTGSFAFANLTSVPVNTFTGSTTTIAGIETGVLASIGFSPLATSGRLEIYSGTTLMSAGTSGLPVYNGNKVKAIAQSSSGYGQTVTAYVNIGLGAGMFTIMTKGSDIIPPTTPTITYPLSGQKLFFVTFERTASIDTGSGIEGYIYEMAEDAGFVDIVNTGFIATTTTGTIGSPSSDFDLNNDIYYWRIKARDRDGNSSIRWSNTGYFEAVDFDNRDFTDKENANLRTYYDSDEINLEGIKAGAVVRASVDENGTLYKNGTDKGTGSYVQNGDDIYVTVRSSNRYDKTVSSVLTIANRTLQFNVTTKQESDSECTLSDDDKETIQTIFDSLVENYSGDQNKFEEFLNTMKSMLADEIDFTNDCNLQYLEDLIISVIGDGGATSTGTYIASNCKEYPVIFDSTRSAYTSPIFKVITFFANRDSLGRYIDSKNPGDCHINTYGAAYRIFTNTDPGKHIAPNGKVYLIQHDDQGYASSDFASVKYFSTIDALRSYINSKNLPQEIRSHQVDTSFTPQTYIAPNGKSYTIYKTNRGYMSYKLMKVRYFPTLGDIQYFISNNNKK